MKDGALNKNYIGLLMIFQGLTLENKENMRAVKSIIPKNNQELNKIIKHYRHQYHLYQITHHQFNLRS